MPSLFRLTVKAVRKATAAIHGAHVERLRYILTRQRDDLCHLQAIGQTLSELDQGKADEKSCRWSTTGHQQW